MGTKLLKFAATATFVCGGCYLFGLYALGPALAKITDHLEST